MRKEVLENVKLTEHTENKKRREKTSSNLPNELVYISDRSLSRRDKYCLALERIGRWKISGSRHIKEEDLVSLPRDMIAIIYTYH